MVADPHGAPVESLITDWHPAEEDGTIVQLDIMDIPPSWIVDQVSADAPFKYVAPQGCPSQILYLRLASSSFAQYARFQIMKLVNASFPADQSKATVHTIFHIIPISSLCRAHDSASLSPSVFELVVLSRCDSPVGFWDESKWGTTYYGRMLHVMALQSMRCDPRVSERMDLGVVVESA